MSMTLSIRNAFESITSLSNALPPARMTGTTTPKPGVTKGPDNKKPALTPPMPQRRSRRLTLPLDSTQAPTLSKSWFKPRAKAQLTLEQTTSLLFTKLPAELRELIYTFVICDDGEKGRISIGFRGSPVASMNASNKPGYLAAYRDDDAGQRTWGLDKSVLSLMRTCRVIYTEAIPLLYSTPIFVFSHTGPLTFMAFVAMVIPERRDAIRWLDLEGLDCGEDEEFSYAFVRHLVMHSALPDAQGEGRKLTETWAVGRVLAGMEGVKRRGAIGRSRNGVERGGKGEVLTRCNGI